MTNILLFYTTETGTTKAMAEAVADGVRSVPGAELKFVEVTDGGGELSHDDFTAADGILVGTPVRHRNMHHRVKRVVEEHLEDLWLDDRLVGKVGGVFTVGGGHGDVGAGAELCQLGVLGALAASGVIPVPFPKCTPGADDAGLHWGPSGRTGGPKMTPHDLTDGMLTAARHHGANVARVAAAIRTAREAGELFARGNVAPPPEVLEMFRGDG